MAGEGRLVAGRYRLISELGAGGFGRVWKARDENLHVDVAVKAIELSQVGSDKERAERVARAMREARNAAQLRTHPNIVAVHDVAMDGGVPWIVMELVTGHSLDEEIDARGRLPVERLGEVARAVLEALRAAHAAGIVHRDVKPSNVLLADDGRILLADFGIAVHDTDTKMTSTGVMIGSPEYLAPERIERGDDGPASDLFSLGVTLYQAAEGVSPFRRPTPAACLAAILSHKPPPPQHAGHLADLITRLLGKDSRRRPTAEAALPALKDPPTETSRTPHGVVASHVVQIVVAAGAFVWANFVPIMSEYWTDKSSSVQTAHVTETFDLGNPLTRQPPIGNTAVASDWWLVAVLGIGTAAMLALAALFPLLLRSADRELKAIGKGAYVVGWIWVGFLALITAFILVTNVSKQSDDNPTYYIRSVPLAGMWLMWLANVVVMIVLRRTERRLRQSWTTQGSQRPQS